MSRFRIRVSIRLKILFRITDWVRVRFTLGFGSVLRSRPGSGLRLSSDIGKVQS